MHGMGLVRSTVITREADIMVTNGRHLFADFFRIPDIILVGESHKFARGPHRCRLEVGIQALIMLIDKDMDKGIARCILLANLHSMIRRSVILYDDFLQRISLGNDRI